MLPYIIAAPLIFVVALVWPTIMSLHALVIKDSNEIRTWLIYWIIVFKCMVLMLVPGVEFLVMIPFTIFESVFFDIYYVVVLTIFFLLVNPKVRLLDTVVNKYDLFIDVHLDKCKAGLLQKYEKFKPLACEAAQELSANVKKLSKMGLDAAKRKSAGAAAKATAAVAKKKK